jgi:hypothetical protein
MIEINNNNQSATVTTDFDTVHARLQENPGWVVELLENAGEYKCRVNLARRYIKWFGTGPSRAQVVDEGPDCFMIWGITGKGSTLAYRIEREGENRIRVTPLAYMERKGKILLAFALVMIYIVPVLLSPLIWRLHEERTLRASRVYLPTFGRYLEEL